MKPQADSVAERTLAQHCPELLPAALPQRDLLAEMQGLAEDLARDLSASLIGVASGGDITITCSEPAQSNTTAFINRMGRTMAHCVIAAESSASLLFSIDHRAAHILTDRAYGGTGEVADDLPADLPLSADLTLRQIEASWHTALARVVPSTGQLTIARRGTDLGRLDPFRGQADCLQIDLTVEQEGHAPWTITLSAAPRDLAHYCDCHTNSANMAAPARQPIEPSAQPFGDIALPARAVLAQTSISLTRASALAIGEIIPLPIAREVPLMIGDAAIARGTIGTLDDCVALQITRSF